MVRRYQTSSWIQEGIRLTAHVDGTLTLISVEGALTLDADPRFARHVHELVALNDTDAAVVDFRRCEILFSASEAAEALGPIYADAGTVPRPIAMICSSRDFDRFEDFAFRAGYSHAVRRAFMEFDAAVRWAAQKGRGWRAREIDLRPERRRAQPERVAPGVSFSRFSASG